MSAETTITMVEKMKNSRASTLSLSSSSSLGRGDEEKKKELELLPEDDTTTTFGGSLYSPTILSVLVSNLQFEIPITAFLELNPSDPTSFESRLITAWPTITEPARHTAQHTILRLLRQHYPTHPPPFGSVPFLHTSSGFLTITERLDPRLLPHLHTPLPNIPTIPRCSLNPLPLSRHSPKSWSSQIRLVTHPTSTSPLIAKGPSSSSSFTELHTLLALPRHKHIMPAPTALITVSTTNPRICGFLLPYHAHGNLDTHATALHAAGHLTARKLADWTRQLIEALHWLHHTAGSFHGDLKPDNIILTSTSPETLMLIDFSQDDYTAATAAPEVAGRWSVVEAGGRCVYTPPEKTERWTSNIGTATKMRDWPKEAREKAEVYAMGRTIAIVASGVGMTELYMRLFEDGGYEYRTDAGEGGGGRAGAFVRRVVEACTREAPGERCGLGELKEMCRAWEKAERGARRRRKWSCGIL